MNLNEEWEMGKMMHTEMSKVTSQDNDITSHP